MNINHLGALLQVNTIASHTFIPCLMKTHPVIVDLGANRGEFYSNLPAAYEPARYIAVEPNPQLAAALRLLPRVEVIESAIGDRDGIARFLAAENPEASVVLPPADGSAGQAVNLRRFSSLISDCNLDRIDLLKVDIEGAEWPLIMESDATHFQPVHQMTIEFHDFCGYNTPGQVDQMISRLREYGFHGIRFSRDNCNWCFVRSTSMRGRDALRVRVAKHLTAPLRRAKHAVQNLLQRDPSPTPLPTHSHEASRQ
jgi:FkbM family methyltransferase